MNVFEKLVELKKASIFKFIRPDIMLSIAKNAHEKLIEQGELILKKDDFGNTMYIIISGKVKIHDQDKLIKELGPSEIFGELAALSPEKRIASVTTLEPTFVLSIDHETLYNLMDLEPEISKGIILFLCKRMREIANKQTAFAQDPH